MDELTSPVVLAAVAHPDDIEFFFGGTLLLLSETGCPIHMWNLADGSCGTLSLPSDEIVRIRAAEAQRSATLAGATIHPPLFRDLEVFYDKPSLSAVAAVVRSIRPQIILTHSASDYMEDHQNVCRLITTAAFSRSMPNYSTSPERPPYADPLRIYHAPPHDLIGTGENAFRPHLVVDVGAAMDDKARMLECHESQDAWLGSSQGIDTPVEQMRRLCRSMAAWGDDLEYAEIWRRHAHPGFCPPDFDPLTQRLLPHLQHLTP